MTRERERESNVGQGLPIGNLTSQLFANIYLNELDQFVKHQLRIRYYLRYCDDFLILDRDEKTLAQIREPIERFLNERLNLELHPRKVIVRKLRQGIDFLGYVTLPRYRVLRTRTKQRLLRRINAQNLPSYLGLLKHCRGAKIERQVYDTLLDAAVMTQEETETLNFED